MRLNIFDFTPANLLAASGDWLPIVVVVVACAVIMFGMWAVVFVALPEIRSGVPSAPGRPLWAVVAAVTGAVVVGAVMLVPLRFVRVAQIDTAVRDAYGVTLVAPQPHQTLRYDTGVLGARGYAVTVAAVDGVRRDCRLVGASEEADHTIETRLVCDGTELPHTPR